MATRISKTHTKWADVDHSNGSDISDVQLTYSEKLSEADILQATAIEPKVLWNGGTSINKFYYGDNLPFLAHLLCNPSVFHKVRLIYIDPPYATNGVFRSRNQKDAYPDLLTGSQYIEFLRQRLILLRELLAEDGSIYVHLDENMVFHIKVIMDEIFGAKHFRNFITRRKSSHKNYTRKTYGNISDYILFYSKSDRYVWNRPVEQWTEERAKKEYIHIEPGTGRRYKKVPIHAPGERNGATGGPWRGMLPPPGKHWQYTPDQLDAMDARGEIYWSGTGNPRRKIYLDESNGVPLQDIWYEYRDTQNQNTKITGYPTEKNASMMKVLIEASSNPGDIILDCFAGSGTTLDVAGNLGRHWIGMDNSPEALRTTLRRFAYGAERMGDYVNHGMNAILQQTIMFETNSTFTRKPVTDFTLFSSQLPDKEIVELIQLWQTWLQQE